MLHILPLKCWWFLPNGIGREAEHCRNYFAHLRRKLKWLRKGNTFSDKGQYVVKFITVLQQPCHTQCHRQCFDPVPGQLPALPEKAGRHKWQTAVMSPHSIPWYPNLCPCHPLQTLLATPLHSSIFPLFSPSPSASQLPPTPCGSFPGFYLPVPLALCPISPWFSWLSAFVALTSQSPSPPSTCAPHSPHALLVLHWLMRLKL